MFQVFLEVSNRVILNITTILYNMHSNIDNERICTILAIYLSEKIGLNLTLCWDLLLLSYLPNLNVITELWIYWRHKIAAKAYFYKYWCKTICELIEGISTSHRVDKIFLHEQNRTDEMEGWYWSDCQIFKQCCISNGWLYPQDGGFWSRLGARFHVWQLHQSRRELKCHHGNTHYFWWVFQSY